MTEIKMTDDESKAGINGFNMKGGTFLVLRKIDVEGNITSVKCILIGISGRGELKTILLQKAISSFTEAVQQLKGEVY